MEFRFIMLEHPVPLVFKPISIVLDGHLGAGRGQLGAENHYECKTLLPKTYLF
jgi:hypothetical protein